VLATLGGGRVVHVTAGWRHDEADDEALDRDIGPEGTPLRLYRWFEDLAETAPRTFAGYKAQQDEIRRLTALYRLRLATALQALRGLVEEQQRGDNAYVRAEIDDALDTLRRLRERFVSGCDAVRTRFADEFDPYREPAVHERLAQIRSLVLGARAVLVAGGHVGVLYNRLEFWQMGPLLREAMEAGTAVVAWSAGAMAMTERIVLFHDDPPTGRSEPEVLDRGLGLAPALVALPHARERLHLDDRLRVATLASRFAPDACVAMENGAWLQHVHGAWVNRGTPESALRLGPWGSTTPLRPAPESSA
jgi:hypothetical protein